MRLIVLGAPGAGKGTQARNIANQYNIDHISTGDILRELKDEKTEIAVSIAEMMNKGQLVPDDLIIRLVKERIRMKSSVNGFILDGFPRTLKQAEIFDDILQDLSLKLDRVIYVKVSDETIIERMSGRLICPHCGAMYHTIYYPPEKADACNDCGTKLIQREDDKAKTVENRLRIYHEITEPIIEYYHKKGILSEFDGIGDMEEISNTIISALNQK